MIDVPNLQSQDPEIAAALENERKRQIDEIVLIASENYASAAVLEATGSVMTNKYAEGYPGADTMPAARTWTPSSSWPSIA